ncbi:N-acetylglucosamine kinase [Kitasatospora sp. DSM 101779]|uniref:N-acetylglucosamine kinase n=1 Tax=Kitasatospora sp. DSM 101779 TaxID=2853165 RepID=UPI0021D7D364|nr:BadF/BadG/BcrA/BcrD ATPase family protein [Kitasatospora sp. DSM 101779]MCU7824653.1 ATPase [Kitasatospora sp. DSM 101779]
MTGPLVLGLDAGGTGSRAVVADLHGRVLGRARGEGANPVAHGRAAAARAVGATVRAALAGLDPSEVAAGVVGLAGALVAEPGLDGLWPEVGLTVTPRTTSDLALAYTAGTGSPDGSVLIGGTGAVAAEVRDHTPVRLADGHGWLLGDLGSGQWLGREAVRLALAAVDAGRPLTGTAAAAAEALAGRSSGDGLRAALLGAVYAEPPVRLARLAPLVLDAAAAGESEAKRLVDEAAGHLLATLGTVRPAGSARPVVLAGGVLGPGTPLADAVRTGVAARWPAAEVRTAGSTAGAAAWLAARTLGRTAATEDLHRALVASGT